MGNKVSFIIVNYNTGGLLRNCLESIRNNVKLPFEVIVVDNHSSDESLNLCNKIFLSDERYCSLPLDENIGFAKGCNYGAKMSSGNFLYFLNPDTEIEHSLDRDISYVMEHPDTVYVSPLVNPNGSEENPKRVMPTLKNIFLWNIRSRKAAYWYKGASVFLSREMFIHLGQWPEDYFMYSEDLDLFFNIWKKGIPVKKLSTPILHFGGVSSSKVWSSLEREIAVQTSFRIFYDKYFPTKDYNAVKIYFLLHNLFRHPKRALMDIKAWRVVSKSWRSDKK